MTKELIELFDEYPELEHVIRAIEKDIIHNNKWVSDLQYFMYDELLRFTLTLKQENEMNMGFENHFKDKLKEIHEHFNLLENKYNKLEDVSINKKKQYKEYDIN